MGENVMSDIYAGQDYIDSRDVIKAIDELESLYSDELEELEDDDTSQERVEEIHQECGDELEELRKLRELAEEGEQYAGDWEHGATLIHESVFTEYAQELAYDIGAVDRNGGWPTAHIDWEAAAEELKRDCSEVEFDGETYAVRG